MRVIGFHSDETIDSPVKVEGVYTHRIGETPEKLTLILKDPEDTESNNRIEFHFEPADIEHFRWLLNQDNYEKNIT